MAVVGIILTLGIGLVSLLVWAFWPTRAQRMLRALPGPSPLPLIGNAHQFKRHPYDFYLQLLDWTKKYNKPRLFKAMIGPQPTVILYGADTVEVLLNSTKHMSKSDDYRFLLPWLGTGLLTSDGAKWHSRRKLLTPTFHFRILQDFLQVMNEQAAIMVTKLQPRAESDKSFDIFPYITHCALDIICDSAMGKHVSAQSNDDSEYVTAIYKISELIMQRNKEPWFWPDILYNAFGEGATFKHCLKVLHGFTEKVIRERSAELDEQLSKESSGDGDLSKQLQDGSMKAIGSRKRLAFLDMLLYAARGEAQLDFMDIREEVDTFMFEGHDTTAAAMNWLIHLVGANPDVQEKLHEEMDRVFGDDRERDVTMEDIKELKYLECVIKESLRLFPSVPMFARTFSEDCEVGGYKVAKGSVGTIFTVALHRDPEHFPDPERFNPDRWIPENSRGRHPYCYIPFSAGMRNCIGQKFAMNEEKVLLSAIFRNFSVVACEKREDLRPIGELILRPENGIIVKLSPRP